MTTLTPQLTLDFTTAVLDPRITFTRAANTATVTNSAGLIAPINADLPRFDYDPITLACRGLLIEESRTNILYYSNDFTNAAWTKTGATVTTGAVTAPDGSATSHKVVEDSSTGVHRIEQQRTFATGTYTCSVYAKAAERSWLQIRDGALGQGIWFNLSNGTVGTANNWTGSITSVGNGWYRCVGVRNFTVANAPVTLSIANADNTNTYTGTTGSGIYAFGYQLEAGAFATSYIPTTSAALTRNSDVATITGANFSDWWQATRGGVLVRARPGTVSGVRPWLQFDDGTVNEIIALRGNTTNPELYIVDGGTPQAQIDAGTLAANTDYSLTGWWATNDCKARLDSGAVVTDTSATIPTVTQARLGSDGTNYLNGHIASIGYYDRFSSQIYTRRKNKAVFSLL